MRKKAFAFTLWHDGPAVNPISVFGRNAFVMKEYNHASIRDSLEEAECRYCDPSAELEEADRQTHLAWHARFRKFVALRTAKYPEFKDYTTRMLNNAKNVAAMLASLVELWKQVDPKAPYFQTVRYDDDHKTAAILAAKKAVNATRAAARKAAKEAAIVSLIRSSEEDEDDCEIIARPLGMRLHREMQMKQNYKHL